MLNFQAIRDTLRPIIHRWFERPSAAVLVRLGFTANRATIAGLAITCVAAYFAGTGYFQIAGCLLLLGAVFDLLDGAIARHLGTVGPRGSLMDSVADRISESVLLLGLLIYFTSPQTSLQIGSILAFVALIGSLIVSYIRARAEGLGLEGTAGFLTRPERVVITIGALLVNQPLVLLWILAIGTPLSAMERFISVWILAGKNSTNKD